ncbi:hypothetical protein O9993_22755 [Vibrio lentus]|nr:hypothetical protein [Vibrio lentus]
MNFQAGRYGLLHYKILGSGGLISMTYASSGEIVWWKVQPRIMIDAGGGVYLRFGQGCKLEDLGISWGITHSPYQIYVNDLPALLKVATF